MNKQYEQVKAQFQHRVYSYACYSLRNAADAEDIAQEAFIRLWQHWPQIDVRQAGSWLMRVTHNLIIDHVRRQQTRPQSGEEDPDAIGDTGYRYQRDEMTRIVEESIAKVSEPYRTTLILREIQGMAYQEIADVLEISQDQVRTDLFRGRRKLREQVKQHPLYSTDLLRKAE